MASSKEMLTPEQANPLLAKMAAADAASTSAYASTFKQLDGLMADIRKGGVTPPLPRSAPPPAAKAPSAPSAPSAPAPAAPAPAPAKADKKGAGDAKGKGGGGEGKGGGGKGGGGEGKGGGGEGKPKGEKKEAAPKGGGGGKGGADPDRPIDISWSEIRVGKILDAVPMEGSDKVMHPQPLPLCSA